MGISCTSAPSEQTFMGELGQDLSATYLSPENLLILGAAFSSSILLDSGYGNGIENRSAEYFDNHDVIPNSIGRQLDVIGSGIFLLGAAGAWHGGSKLWGNRRDEEASLAMLSALSITGVSTLGLKAVIQDSRPNGSSGGFPSGHTSMAMAAAASLGESYGWKVGLPATMTAILVGVQRLDSRKHDLDDVIGGLALGYVVGVSVTGRRMPRILGGELGPIIDPIAGEYGLAVVWNF